MSVYVNFGMAEQRVWWKKVVNVLRKAKCKGEAREGWSHWVRSLPFDRTNSPWMEEDIRQSMGRHEAGTIWSGLCMQTVRCGGALIKVLRGSDHVYPVEACEAKFVAKDKAANGRLGGGIMEINHVVGRGTGCVGQPRHNLLSKLAAH